MTRFLLPGCIIVQGRITDKGQVNCTRGIRKHRPVTNGVLRDALLLYAALAI